MEDKKILRGILGLISWVLTTGWLIYALVYREWLLLVAVVTFGVGLIIYLTLKDKLK